MAPLFRTLCKSRPEMKLVVRTHPKCRKSKQARQSPVIRESEKLPASASLLHGPLGREVFILSIYGDVTISLIDRSYKEVYKWSLVTSSHQLSADPVKLSIVLDQCAVSRLLKRISPQSRVILRSDWKIT